ncbi:unnamed protein product [Ilex paraguariensis]|uniref:Filament-like plant protein 7 n=1 Tax=Ilex paraguariensis TaxID=185542 RepID=A0ABC8SCK4_9AQUA
MESKTWLWKKKSSEKTIVANDKADPSLKGNGQEKHPNEKEIALEKSVMNLNEKLASVLSECDAKDDLVANHARMAQEVIAGREKAEAEVVCLKKELDETLQQRVAADERLTHLNAALKDCMQVLSSVREDQEQRIRDSVMKTSDEFEKAHKKLEEKLSETCKRLANLTVENSRLSMALLGKEKLVEDLSRCKSQVEAEFNTLMARLDSTEKENAFLKYEFRMLEKELEIRNEEIQFSRRSADASHKHHLDSVKKISRLEAECQRLRVLVRKRLPGPAALAKMKSEVEIQGRSQIEMGRRKLNPMTGGVRDSTTEGSLEIPSKKISLLIEQLCNIEDENKILKEILAKKDNELCSLTTVCARKTSKLSQVEAQLAELSKVQKSMQLQPALSDTLSNELSLASYDVGNDDETYHSGSVASALISELEYFRQRNPRNTSASECKMIGVSDMSLMDDFAEMEKLAIVAVDASLGNSYASSDASYRLSDSLTKEAYKHHLYLSCKELVPVVQGDPNDGQQELQTRDVSSGKSCDWLQDVLKVILEQNRFSKRSVEELLEDIRLALQYLNHRGASEAYRAGISKHPERSEALPISGYITWKSPNASPRVGSIKKTPDIGTTMQETHSEYVQSNLSRSICRMIELIRRIDSTCSTNCTVPDSSGISQRTLPQLQSTIPSDYLVHVFQWKSCELRTVLRQFVNTCTDLLHGKVDFEKFAEELASTLYWIVNKCIAFQDASSLREKTKEHFGDDESACASESGSVGNCTFSPSIVVHKSEEQSSFSPSITTSNMQNLMFRMEKIRSNLQEENEGLKEELNNMKSSQKELEAMLQSANNKEKALTNQLRESEQSIGNLQTEVDTMKESKRMIEDQFENQKLINEDLDTQLNVAKAKLNEVLLKLSALEVELDDKSHCCEDLEGTCLELQLQLESITNKDIPEDDIDQEEKLLQTGWEISAASAKLAECQETIFNLGKQLKALASPKEAAIFDKVFSNTSANNKKLIQRSSLRDRMLAEDGDEPVDLNSPKTKEIISTAETKTPTIIRAPNFQVAPPEGYLALKPEFRTVAVGAPLAIVPSKKRGGRFGLLRKLMLKRKRGKTSVSFAT